MNSDSNEIILLSIVNNLCDSSLFNCSDIQSYSVWINLTHGQTNFENEDRINFTNEDTYVDMTCMIIFVMVHSGVDVLTRGWCY